MTTRAIRRLRRRSALAPNGVGASPEIKRSYLVWTRLQGLYRRWVQAGSQRQPHAPLHLRWVASFDDFYADLGPIPENHTVQALDPLQPLGPKNCRLVEIPVSPGGQPRRGVQPLLISADGATRSIREWAEVLGIADHQLRYRLWKGETIEDQLAQAQSRSTTAAAA
jgi:hypothetical protein